MDAHDRVLRMVRENPGTPKSTLCEMFQLSRFRLNQALRLIERNVNGVRVVHDNENGVWIVDVDPQVLRRNGVAWP